MKKVIILLCVLTLSLPVFATGTYYEGCNDNITYTSNNGVHEYYEKLKADFYKKYTLKKVGPNHVETTAPVGAYQREVTVPLIDYMVAHPAKFPSN